MPVPETLPPALTAAAPSKRWRESVLALVSARRAGSLATHCLLAWPVALLPSLALLALVYWLAAVLRIDVSSMEPPKREASFREFFGGVVFAPLVETLLLAGLLRLLSSISARSRLVAAASGVLWGCLHGLFGALWFFGTCWSFYVFSCSFLAWRPLSWWKAYAVAALPHALINLTALSLVLFD